MINYNEAAGGYVRSLQVGWETARWKERCCFNNLSCISVPPPLVLW